MHAQHQRGALERQRALAEIFGAQLANGNSSSGPHFPQEVEIDLLRDGVGLFHQLARARLVEFEQHVFGA